MASTSLLHSILTLYIYQNILEVTETSISIYGYVYFLIPGARSSYKCSQMQYLTIHHVYLQFKYFLRIIREEMQILDFGILESASEPV
jgi:hypothetical protein